MKQWVVEDKEHGFDGLVYKDAAVPKVGENEVLVKLHAASLNYRDLVIPKVWIRKRKYDIFTLIELCTRPLLCHDQPLISSLFNRANTHLLSSSL